MCQNVKRTCRAVVLNFNGDKLPGNLKNCIKKSKDKAVPGKGSFNVAASVEKLLFVYL